jgi:hypothetical protein
LAILAALGTQEGRMTGMDFTEPDEHLAIREDARR